MADIRRMPLRLRAFGELVRYDFAAAVFGFRSAYGGLRKPISQSGWQAGLEDEISQAVDWATCFYWKRVRCLQRSIVAARLLRAHGVPAELVIGCRLAPFLGHAWVEVEGRVLSGPGGFPQKLQILDRV